MRKYILFIVLVAQFISCKNQSKEDFSDVIIHNANIYSLNWSDPSLEGEPALDAPFKNGKWYFDAQAIAIKNNLIQFVGSDKEVQKYIGKTTKIINANKAIVIPGLIESHGHLQELGEKNEAINLEDLTKQQILDLIIKRAKETPKGEWIIASGWDEAVFANDYPDMTKLSHKTLENPVVLIGLRGFGVMGNKLAFEKADITKNVIPENGGEILKDRKGNFKYVLLNSAKKLLLDKIPKKSLEQQTRIMQFGFNEMLRLGFTTTHHAGVEESHMEVYEGLLKNNMLPMRVHAFIAARMYNVKLVDKWLKKGPTTNDASFLQVRNFKAYYDGSLGSRGANFIEDYADKKNHTGVGGKAYGFHEDMIVKALDAGFQLAIHAIGDKANRDVLDLYENYFKTNPNSKDLRHRIEHVQVVHPDDFSRFYQLNIIASMEPAHAVEDMPWAIDRVGELRAKGAYAWRTLRNNNATVIFNSDFTGSDPSFFYGMYSAITKKKKEQEKQWFPEQAFSKEESLRAYTIWAAYAANQEKLTGTIEVGKWADLTFMDVDVLNATPKEILEGTVLKTMINGKLAFEKK
ncbi:MAG: amidohydrolase [Polaribacter sp.]|nr:amidohydrolase [Polaribacter sp.]MDG1811656.1 amidohydrolase [Polaribacter sp.]MDG1993580.1 amidohydrolase [Polaribacter sp.]